MTHGLFEISVTNGIFAIYFHKNEVEQCVAGYPSQGVGSPER